MDVLACGAGELLCSVGGPVLFIHDKCALHAWAAPNRLNTSWKWFVGSNSRGKCQWKAGWSPDMLAQAYLELFWCKKPFLVRLSYLLPVSPPFPGIPSCCGNSCLFRFPSGGKLPAQAEENLLAWCEGLLWIPLQVIINLFISLRHGYRAHYGVSPQFSLSLLLPPCSLSSDILYYTHTHIHAHTHWHFWLQWLPSGEMKSYFCFQITDCQSNKWICSHQQCEIDILFSNFNLFSREGCCLVGLPLTQLFFSISLAIRQWDVAAVCQKGLIFHLSSPLSGSVVGSHSDEHWLVCLQTVQEWVLN